ncbi:MAG: Mut7-C RNAse domain-containing protein [Desulfobacter sp.]
MAKSDANPGSEIVFACRFAAELVFFLRRKVRCRDVFCRDVRRRAFVKDHIESFGVPHTEVGRILFNKTEVDFSFIPFCGGTLDVFAVVPPFNVLAESLLRPTPFEKIRFIADLNVLRLGRYLLLIGFDVALARDMDDTGIARVAADEQRIVLTRDTRLLCRRNISFTRRIRASNPLEQLREVIDFFGLSPEPGRFFSRCIHCNRSFVPVEKKRILHRLEPKTRIYFHDFLHCPDCGRIFWKGSHHDAVMERFRAFGIL